TCAPGRTSRAATEAQHQRAGRPDERPDVHLPVEHHRHGRQVAPMNPADRPDPSPEPLPDDPDGSAPGPPEPEDLDVLVDRLAAEQARQSEAAPEQGPGSALLAEEMTTLLSILDGQREAVARKVD